MHAGENTFERASWKRYKYLKKSVETGWKFVNLRNFRNLEKFRKVVRILENFVKF